MSPNAVKILVGLVLLSVAGGISLAVYFGTAQASASVSQQGDHAQSKVSQSAGILVLEITNQGDNSECNSWTFAEYAVVCLTFIILLKCSHVFHHCYWTKRQIKSSLKKERARVKIDHDKHVVVPADRVIVPDI